MAFEVFAFQVDFQADTAQINIRDKETGSRVFTTVSLATNEDGTQSENAIREKAKERVKAALQGALDAL